MAIDPDYLEAYCNLGIALRAQGRLEAALAVYGRALELDPKSALVLNNLALVLHDRGKLSSAVATYRRALDIKPDYAEAWNNLGAALRDRDQLDQAVAASPGPSTTAPPTTGSATKDTWPRSWTSWCPMSDTSATRSERGIPITRD